MLEQASILESPDTVAFREEKKQYFAFTVFFSHSADSRKTDNTLKLGGRPGNKIFQTSYARERNLSQSIRTHK